MKTNVKHNHSFYPRSLNLTNIHFDDKESELLCKWEKYNPPSNPIKNHDIKELVIETETAISYVDKNKQDKIRYEAANVIEKVINKSKNEKWRNKAAFVESKNTIKGIKEKLSINSAKIIPADKATTSVIILENDLNDKVSDYIMKNDISEVEDKTKLYNKNIKTLINNSCVIHPDRRKRLYNSKALPPLSNLW